MSQPTHGDERIITRLNWDGEETPQGDLMMYDEHLAAIAAKDAEIEAVHFKVAGYQTALAAADAEIARLRGEVASKFRNWPVCAHFWLSGDECLYCNARRPTPPAPRCDGEVSDTLDPRS